jgi:hypothetical protein
MEKILERGQYYSSTKARGAHKGKLYYVEGNTVYVSQDGRQAKSMYDLEAFARLIRTGHMVEV